MRDTNIAEAIAEISAIFNTARNAWARLSEEIHPELTGTGVLVMQFIIRNGPVTATGIGQVLNLDKAVVSRHIAKLRELGFVDAEAAREDRRVLLLTASEAARTVSASLHRRWAADYHARFDGWTDAEVAGFSQALHRFNEAADAPLDSPATKCARDHRAAEQPDSAR